MKKSISAIVLCAGKGERMNLDITKQRISICGKTLIYHTVSALEKSDLISCITVVAKRDEMKIIADELKDCKKVRSVISGGDTRAESAKIGFESLSDECKYVLIHDGARPFVTSDMIEKVFLNAVKHGASTASTVVTDTIKDVDANGFIVCGRDRDSVRLMQTPQIFKKELYSQALEFVDVKNPALTDDNMLLELIGKSVYCTETGKENIKITVFEDIAYAEYLMKRGNING